MRARGLIEEIRKRDDLGEVVWEERLGLQRARYRRLERPLPERLARALGDAGIERLFSHQALAIDLIRDGLSVVVTAPAASGKSLIYNAAILEGVLGNADSRALCIFPLKGLEQDQYRNFTEIAKAVGVENPSAIYDGDTGAHQRRKTRDRPPSVIFTNPDMLSLSMLPHHAGWEGFFRDLRFVVIDEMHAYKGVFGSHVAHVLRRLRRVCGLYGSKPVFIASSATMANPGELARTLTGMDFRVVNESGAPAGERRFLFINPLASPYACATRLFTLAVGSGLKTIAFTKARKVAELMHRRANEEAPALKGVISSYRAGFLPEQRRDIEKRLFSGELAGVISTSALELGVDVGGLDVCILVGYPGTISSTWQRAGRVGRRGRDSLVIMVALDDALDQYFMRHPRDFFSRGPEAAFLDDRNEKILKAHLARAADELPIAEDEDVYGMGYCGPELKELEERRVLRRGRGANGAFWFPRFRRRMPGGIRDTGDAYRIMRDDGSLLGTAASTRVFRELHPGAIYLHMGENHLVQSLDTLKREAVCAKTALDYHTSARTIEETCITRVDEGKAVNNLRLARGMLRVTETVTGYYKRDARTRRLLGMVELRLPPTVFTTSGVWMAVDDDILKGVIAMGYGAAGSLHALEHALIAVLPLLAMCDRMDIGGTSYTMNPELGSAAIFIHDGHEGGIGLVKKGFDAARDWFEAASRLMQDCPCEVSCPSCTQDPMCGNANDPLDKRGALEIVKRWLGDR